MTLNVDRDPRPLPVLAAVSPKGGLVIEVVWDVDTREGVTELIDLSPLVNSFKFYRLLRNDDTLFRSVHLIDEGRAVGWGDDAVDMSATAIERLAEESLTCAGLENFIQSHNLTHEALASLLGYSRRQIENFLSGTNPVPRVVALACMALSRRLSEGAIPTLTTQHLSPRIIYASLNSAFTETTGEVGPMYRLSPISSVTSIEPVFADAA